MEQRSVSASQFFSLLFLSILSTVFMYISSPDVTVAETETLLRPIVFVVVSIIVSVPVFFIYKNHLSLVEKGVTVRESAFFRVIAILYGVSFFISALRSAARFDLFASSELFPGTDMTLFLIVIITACGYLSHLGLGALCRGGVIFSFIVCAVTGFVMLSLADEVDMLNFTPLFKDSFTDFLGDSLWLAVQASEVGAILLFITQIKGNVTRHFLIWIILSALVFVAVFFFVIGSLGAFADTQLFPTYSSVTLADFGLLERVDALETAIWIFCVVEKISFYILIVSRCFSYAFRKFSEKMTVTLVCVVLVGALMYISNDIRRFGFMSNVPLVTIVYIVSCFLLPLSVLIYLRRVKPYEKIREVD